MKLQISIIALALAATFSAQASVDRAPCIAPAEFDALIKENKKSELALKAELEKQAGIRFDERLGHVSREKMKSFESSTPDQVAVATNANFFKKNVRKAVRGKGNDMTRVSQEMNGN